MSNEIIDWLASLVVGAILAIGVLLLGGPMWAAAGFGYLAFADTRGWLA